jgi:hypothetical protein
MGGVFTKPKAPTPQPDPATRYAQNIASGLQLLLLDYHQPQQRFLKVLQPMQMDLQQVLRQKEKADQQPY